ncbi:unnamed protein product [Oikopleura dioica]|uniref:Uncharacterized protein n=1 Tax=Oikopleura dioica TaxID=34765 RepID=E4XIB3_OIKDI|nr:unnamed protein product [Oikopleura dioica]
MEDMVEGLNEMINDSDKDWAAKLIEKTQRKKELERTVEDLERKVDEATDSPFKKFLIKESRTFGRKNEDSKKMIERDNLQENDDLD